jgi:pentafunctional AROM polypeptide
LAFSSTLLTSSSKSITVGKTTLATIAATALGWEHIDTDAVFEHREQRSIAAYIAEFGWNAFRTVESQILHDLLRAYPTNKIIACGGGVVELESNRVTLQAFKEHGVVMHVMREKDAVLKYLRECTHHPPFYHETAVEAWDRRVEWFRECSSFDFVSLTVDIPSTSGESSETAITPEQTLALKPVEEEFFRLLRFIHGIDTNKVALVPRTRRSYFLCLTYKDVREAIPVFDDLSQGIDMWDIRADLLGSLDPTCLAFQVAVLRRYSNLPILFTLRTVNQGGKYQDPADSASASALHALLQHALRLGVEYLDLQISYPKDIFLDLVGRKGNTSIIGSYHNCSGSISWTGQETKQIYEALVQRGSDIVEIINVAKSWEDNLALRQFVSSVEKNSTPLIAVNMFHQVSVEYEIPPAHF